MLRTLAAIAIVISLTGAASAMAGGEVAPIEIDLAPTIVSLRTAG